MDWFTKTNFRINCDILSVVNHNGSVLNKVNEIISYLTKANSIALLNKSSSEIPIDCCGSNFLTSDPDSVHF
jgi:hypothetical protein